MLSGIVLAQVELQWVMLARLQVPKKQLVALYLVLHKEVELAAEEGEQQGNQTDSHWMDNMSHPCTSLGQESLDPFLKKSIWLDAQNSTDS